MNEQKHLKKISKLLSLILRHKPEVIGITLDENGWADVSELISSFPEEFFPISRKDIEEVVASNDKKRFSFDESGNKIRANQGHSVSVKVEMEEKEPPATLYHGTVEKFLKEIFADGLLKMNRQHVHLSQDLDTARNVGGRRGKPVILKVNAGAAFSDGIRFFLSENQVWLTDHVPAKYLMRM